MKFNLAPPLFAKKDAKGHLVKAEFGSWMWRAFKLLAKAKGLRGGTFDLFGYTAERKMERALIVEYRELLAGLLVNLTAENLGHLRGTGIAAGENPRLRPRQGSRRRDLPQGQGTIAGCAGRWIETRGLADR